MAETYAIGKLKMSPDVKPAERLIAHALEIGAIKLFVENQPLKDGRLSPYFFNSGGFSTGKSLAILATAYAEILIKKNLVFPGEYSAVLFGPTYKDIMLVAAIAQQLYINYGINVGVAHGEEAKDHDEGGLLVSTSLAHKRVIIIGDEITDGKSKNYVMKLIEDAGGKPCACVIAFDRQEVSGTGKDSAMQEFSNSSGIPVFAAATCFDLIKVLTNFPEDRTSLTYKFFAGRVYEYLEKYGVTKPTDK